MGGMGLEEWVMDRSGGRLGKCSESLEGRAEGVAMMMRVRFVIWDWSQENKQ